MVWVSVRQKREQGRAGMGEEGMGAGDGHGVGVGQCVNRTPGSEWDPQRGSGGIWLLSSCPQDVDGVLSSKMELEGMVEALKEYICFLRHLYEEVRITKGRSDGLPGAGGREGRGQVGRLLWQ